MVNIYDAANKLAEDLTQTDQYKKLQEAIKAVEDDKDASALFKRWMNCKIRSCKHNKLVNHFQLKINKLTRT